MISSVPERLAEIAESTDELPPLPPDVETLARCEALGLGRLIVLDDPQIPATVERLAEMVREHRSG